MRTRIAVELDNQRQVRCPLVAESGPSKFLNFAQSNVRFGEKRTFGAGKGTDWPN